MEVFSRRTLIPLLALILLSAVFFLLIPARIHGAVTPSVLLTTAIPTDRFAPPVEWVDDLESRLRTYFTKKYPTYDFTPYADELDRIRGAVTLGDRWGARREMGRFLSMLTSRAYGLSDDAAEELADLSQRLMPDEQFGIVYPGWGTDP
jgi:hypothetical protein